MARKNIHGKQGVRFKKGYTAASEKRMLRNVVTDLIVHESITVTKNTAKLLCPLFDRLVTYAKKGEISHRRLAARIVRNVTIESKVNEMSALQKLFDDIAPRMKGREGGYTSVIKCGNRRGDNAPMVIVKIV